MIQKFTSTIIPVLEELIIGILLIFVQKYIDNIQISIFLKRTFYVVLIIIFLYSSFLIISQIFKHVEHGHIRFKLFFEIIIVGLCIIIFIKINGSTIPIEHKETNEDCKIGYVCFDFINKDNLTGWEYFKIDADNNHLFYLKDGNEKKLDNPNLLTQQTFNIENNFELKVKFHDKNKGNLTIIFGEYWRCIVGENDYDRIVVETYYNRNIRQSKDLYKNIKKRSYENTYNLYKRKRPPICPDKDVMIYGAVRIINLNSIMINLRIEYYDFDNNLLNESFDFKLKLAERDLNLLRSNIGVGLIGIDDSNKIEFLNMQIK